MSMDKGYYFHGKVTTYHPKPGLMTDTTFGGKTTNLRICCVFKIASGGYIPTYDAIITFISPYKRVERSVYSRTNTYNDARAIAKTLVPGLVLLENPDGI